MGGKIKMKWFKLAFILLLPISLMGWQRGGVCDGGGLIGEQWIAETRVDSFSSNIHLDPGSNSYTTATTDYRTDQLLMSFYTLSTTNKWATIPLNLYGDSVYIDSIGYVAHYSGTPGAGDTIDYGLIKPTFERIGGGHHEDEVVVYTSWIPNLGISAWYLFILPVNYSGKSNEFGALCFYRREGAGITNVYLYGAIVYYRAFYRRYGIPE